MTGRVTDRFSAAHDRAGIAAMISRLRRDKVTEVAIERGDGPLVDALLAAGLTVVVITSRQVKNLRSRFGAVGAKDDSVRCVRAGGHAVHGRARLRPLIPDAPATISLRTAVRARRDLVRHRVAACNQLRAHLAVAFPVAFTQIVDVVRDKFGLRDMVMVGDRGMITSARIAALNQAGDGTPRTDTYGWITALRPRPSAS